MRPGGGIRPWVRVPQARRILTPGQAARILGVSPKTVNRWATDGRIPCAVTLGGHRRFRVDVIRFGRGGHGS